MLIIAGTMTIDAEQRDAFGAAATELRRLTLAEDGCQAYVFSPDFEDAGTIHLYEKWTSMELLQAHLATAHVKAFGQNVKGIVRERNILKYEVSSEGPLR